MILREFYLFLFLNLKCNLSEIYFEAVYFGGWSNLIFSQYYQDCLFKNPILSHLCFVAFSIMYYILYNLSSYICQGLFIAFLFLFLLMLTTMLTDYCNLLLPGVLLPWVTLFLKNVPSQSLNNFYLEKQRYFVNFFCPLLPLFPLRNQIKLNKH